MFTGKIKFSAPKIKSFFSLHKQISRISKNGHQLLIKDHFYNYYWYLYQNHIFDLAGIDHDTSKYAIKSYKMNVQQKKFSFWKNVMTN